MFKTIFLSKIQPGRIRWIGLSLTGASILLFITFIANVALASSYESTPKSDIPPLALQATATPTLTLQVGSTSVYSFSVATLGYEEVTLASPFGRARYSFRLPENWAIQSDGILILDLSYVYNQSNSQDYPPLFGDLTVTLDNQTLEIFPIEEELDHHRLRVSLPASLLANSDRTQHVIGLALDAGLLCEIPHEATLLIHPTSSVSITYNQRPLVLDLSRYPWPFYQRAAFEPDSVRFVLPSQSTAGDLSNALGIAAKLGDLTGKRAVISATTDLDLRNFLSNAPTTLDEHLVVIGRPQDNQLLSLLNDVAELPISLHQQQLGLVTQGPATIAPGDTFTYAFTITNTLDRSVNLTLVDPLPAYVEFMDCSPECSEDDGAKIIRWSGNLLEPDETINLSLRLRATDLLTGTTFENTVTLVEADLGPVNADTLTSQVVTASSNGQPQFSVAGESDYFFAYDGRAVAEGDGVIQEILSPWSANRAILVVTGLSDEAVRKASQAMSSEARFPGMNGAIALVRDALPPSEIEDATPRAVETTFEDLGYQDEVIRGASLQQVDYFFQIPFVGRLADEAAMDLYFSHSEVIDFRDSGLTVVLNDDPVVSVALNDETASDGHIQIALADANVRMGRVNRLSIRVDMSLGGVCANPDSGQVWLLIKRKSKIFLPHDENAALTFDLDYFPYPFDTNRALTDLLFAMPDAPAVDEWEATLRLAADLGDSAAGRTMLPVAMLGSDLPSERLRNYHIIAVGRPTRNGLIQHVNAQLPQSFLPDSDEIEQRLDNVVFRLPSGFDLGYLQLIPSPWNETRAFLAITGTTDESVQWAMRILKDSPWVLEGDLVLVQGDAVKTIDTRKLTSKGVAAVAATAVPEMTPFATPTATITPTPLSSSPTLSSASGEEQSSKGADRPAWLIPLLALNGMIAIGILAIAGWRARQRRL